MWKLDLIERILQTSGKMLCKRAEKDEELR
jgi:hypothetical protein